MSIHGIKRRSGFLYQFPVGIFDALGAEDLDPAAELEDPGEEAADDGHLSGENEVALVRLLGLDLVAG